MAADLLALAAPKPKDRGAAPFSTVARGEGANVERRGRRVP
jgi:hypothetical protein